MANVATRPARQKLMTFRYEAMGDDMRGVKGTLRSGTELSARNVLIERGYTSIALEPIPSPLSLEGAIPSLFKVKPEQVINFSRHLATLLESGVSLLPALQLLSQQRSSSPPFRRILGHITNDLSTGMSLSQAVSRHRQVFPEIYRRTIEIGEQSGRLEAVLKDLANHIEKQSNLTKKLKGAMTYPMILMVVGLVVSVLLLTVVLPPLAELFTTAEAELPLPTKILMGLSNFVVSQKVVLIFVAVLLAFAAAFGFKHPKGRRFKDYLALNMPVLGGPTLMGELARMSHTMALMLGAGLSLQDTMEVLPRTISNGLFRDGLNQVRQRLFLGEGLTLPMAANPIFPPLMIQMVRVGEDSNSLPTTMGVVAEFYEVTAQERIQAMVSLITPLSTIILASLVAFVALSVIMPMYSLTGAF